MDEEYARFIDSRVGEIAASIYLDSPRTISMKTSRAKMDQEALVKRLKSNPNDFFANLQMGTRHHEDGAYREAEAYLKKAQALFPQYVEQGNPYQLLAKIYLETQREDDALAEFEKWIRVDGDSVEPLMEAAKIYTKREDWESVAKLLNRFVYINPYDLEMQERLGKAALESEDWDTAIAAYGVMAALDSTDPAGARYDLARALHASGDVQGAKREILRSLEIAPSYREAQRLLLKISEGSTE
jgi:tetratricopeptide (TPR) repeat protein